jgi:O-acetyl-ADP-ribose deacetylase (regulator of RNase III)
VWNGGRKREAELLADCYHNSLQLAVEHAVKTIAFPNISTGIYRFPKEQAARIAVSTVQAFLAAGNHGIEEVMLVCFDRENLQYTQAVLQQGV